MLVTLKEVLADARAKHYAVPAFDCVEDVLVRTILETAAELRSPVILMCLVRDLEGNGWAYLPGLVRAAAEHHDIPIVLHLDHAVEIEPVKKAVLAGFSSVMLDGSMHPFEKNVELTRAAVELAHRRGISVEGELGYVGGTNVDLSDAGESVLTDSRELAEFVKQTQVDALAVSIGTAHGMVKAEAELNIMRLRELHAISSIPLVLHGGSGVPHKQLREAIQHGICKFNIYAELRMAMYHGLQISAVSQEREDPLPHEVFDPIRHEIAKVVADKIELLGSGNRV